MWEWIPSNNVRELFKYQHYVDFETHLLFIRKFIVAREFRSPSPPGKSCQVVWIQLVQPNGVGGKQIVILDVLRSFSLTNPLRLEREEMQLSGSIVEELFWKKCHTLWNFLILAPLYVHLNWQYHNFAGASRIIHSLATDLGYFWQGEEMKVGLLLLGCVLKV